MEVVEGSGFKIGYTSMFDDFTRQGETCIEYIEAPVFFMLSRRREAIEVIHIGADGREGKKGLRDAARALIEYVRASYPWCRMLLAPISIKSVYNLCNKAGFIDCGTISNEAGTIQIMAVDYGRVCR